MTVRFDVVATIPRMIEDFRGCSVIGRAAENGLISINVHDLRDFTSDRHRSIDDRPFGGGAGMVLKPEPLFACLDRLLGEVGVKSRLILLSPRGRRFAQSDAREYASWCEGGGERGLILICGRYEGVDERLIEHYKPELLSIGDYVIAGGEVAAMVVIEATARLIRGVVGNEESIRDESFSNDSLEYPQYTRPAEFRGMKVPDVLLSGNHAAIREWREKMKK